MHRACSINSMLNYYKNKLRRETACLRPQEDSQLQHAHPGPVEGLLFLQLSEWLLRWDTFQRSEGKRQSLSYLLGKSVQTTSRWRPRLRVLRIFLLFQALGSVQRSYYWKVRTESYSTIICALLIYYLLDNRRLIIILVSVVIVKKLSDLHLFCREKHYTYW